jgi:PAS domain S-box-containing protein
MSAIHPFPGNKARKTPADNEVSERERALEAEVQALRAELARLRLEAPADAPAAVPEPTPRQGTAAVPEEYGALFTALGTVFPIGVFRTKPSGSLQHADEMLQQIFGLEAREFLDFGWLRCVHPDDLDRVKQHWQDGVGKGTGLSLEFRIFRQGSATPTHLIARNIPQHDDRGRVVSQLGFVQDISHLRKLEAEARIKDELNRQIIASSPDCTKVLDLEGHVLQMTAQGCRLVEVDDFEQVRGSDWATWWPEGGHAKAQEALEQAKATGSARFIAFGTTFKGTPKWWDTVVSPIADSEGRPVMMLAVSRDITEPYEQQKQIRQLNTDLESRVQERTAELGTVNERLRQTLQEAQELYNRAPCGYHSVSSDGTYVLINQTELDWLGYSHDEVVGRMRFRDFVLPASLEMVKERLQRLIAGEKLDSVEIGLRRRDGTSFVALLSSTAVVDREGRFVRTNNTLVDITQRKKAETALRENQRFLQTVTNHVPGVISYLDAMLRFRFANDEHARLYGLDPVRILGLHASECLPADIWKEVQPRLKCALEGQVQHYEAWRTAADGVPFYVSATFLPDVNEGLVQGVIVQVIDITERKRVEERVTQLNDDLETRIRERSMELLESEQRFRLMADNLRDYSIFFMDDQGLVTDWTDSAQRMEGFSPSEMLGQHYTKLLLIDSPDNAKESAELMLRMAASRGQHELHTWVSRKDGSRYWSHSILIALRDDSGELRGFSKISRDMTDAKRLDDLMRNINDELENRVVERTEQLLAANKDLESFSYSVSHDLRSPLRHISSFVSLLEEHLAEQSDDTTLRYLNTIGNSARHMSQLIDGLLAFSRLGRSAVNVMPVDFTMLVEAVVSQIAHDTEGRVVDWVIAPDMPVVQGDALLLREVWANLLGNAFKYSRPRERARIEVGWSVDPAVGYTFFVKDNGVGFDTKYAQKLFGVFQRLHRASEFEGTGIGLALTRRILERHGGSIWAESQPGEGSVFHFSLPFEGCSTSEASPDTIPSVLEP